VDLRVAGGVGVPQALLQASPLPRQVRHNVPGHPVYIYTYRGVQVRDCTHLILPLLHLLPPPLLLLHLSEHRGSSGWLSREASGSRHRHGSDSSTPQLQLRVRVEIIPRSPCGRSTVDPHTVRTGSHSGSSTYGPHTHTEREREREREREPLTQLTRWNRAHSASVRSAGDTYIPRCASPAPIIVITLLRPLTTTRPTPGAPSPGPGPSPPSSDSDDSADPDPSDVPCGRAT
jgi:hypothetical protein